MDDVFAKYDLDGNGELTLDDLTKMFQKFGFQFEFKQFAYLFGDKKVNEEGFSLYDFRALFESLLQKTSEEQQKSIFKNLGYDEQLFSYRTRVISVSFHCLNAIQVKNDDSFA